MSRGNGAGHCDADRSERSVTYMWGRGAAEALAEMTEGHVPDHCAGCGMENIAHVRPCPQCGSSELVIA